MKDQIFDYYCKRISSFMNPVGVVPSTEIAKEFKLTIYRARKYIRELVDDGLLESKIEVLYYPAWDDEWYPPCIHRGYALTKKGLDSDNYKKYEAEQREFWNRRFD